MSGNFRHFTETHESRVFLFVKLLYRFFQCSLYFYVTFIQLNYLGPVG